MKQLITVTIAAFALQGCAIMGNPFETRTAPVGGGPGSGTYAASPCSNISVGELAADPNGDCELIYSITGAHGHS